MPGFSGETGVPFLFFRLLWKRKGENMLKRYLEAGKIVNTHGVRGEVVLEPWADTPGSLRGIRRFWFDEGKTDAGFVSSRPHKGRLLLTLQGVDTVEKANALRGKVLYLCRDDMKLEPGVYFLQDLIGLAVMDGNTGQEYGTVREVLFTGANKVYRIVDGGGREYLFPAVPHMVKRIAPEEGVMELLPIPGIFDGDSEEA